MNVIEANVRLNVTPQLLADAWWSMCSDEQAEFFAHLATLGPMHKLETQAHYIRQSCEKHSPAALEAAMTFTGCIYRYGFLDDQPQGWQVAGVWEAQRWIAGMRQELSDQLQKELA